MVGKETAVNYTLAPFHLLGWMLSLVPVPKTSVKPCCIPTADKAFDITFLMFNYWNLLVSPSILLKSLPSLFFLDLTWPKSMVALSFPKACEVDHSKALITLFEKSYALC